jgi:hypothetical protein
MIRAGKHNSLLSMIYSNLFFTRQARGEQYEGEGGPLDKLEKANDERGGFNDNDVVNAGFKPSSGLGTADELAEKGQEAMRSNVGRNPPGPGGSHWKGSHNDDSVPDADSAQGYVAPDSAVETARGD